MALRTYNVCIDIASCFGVKFTVDVIYWIDTFECAVCMQTSNSSEFSIPTMNCIQVELSYSTQRYESCHFSSSDVFKWNFRLFFPGLTAKPFRGESSIIEVECTSEVLNSDIDVFQMTLFAFGEVKFAAYVNPLKGECLTSLSFSSCVIEDNDSRRTKLRTLVLDLQGNDSRDYGCNVSSSKGPGESIGTTTWKITVKSISELAVISCATCLSLSLYFACVCQLSDFFIPSAPV